MKTILTTAAVCAAALLSHLSSAQAHFLQLLPSSPFVSNNEERALTLDIRFTHPMEGGPVMEMARPVRFGVQFDEAKHDLLPALEARKINGATAYSAQHHIKRAGDYIYYIEPAPYWEPGEEVMIVHYTKVVVNAFGREAGWDQDVGLPVEIRPLSRPYGLWTNNIFSGQVLYQGQPVPGAIIEVEYKADGKIAIPAPPYITQTITADANGVFHYAMPKAGWWGFAALIEGKRFMQAPDGRRVPVEEGGLIWVHTQDIPS